MSNDWKAKELARKKKEERESNRISSRHNLLGELESCPHRDKEMPLRWTRDGDTWHVEPTRVSFGSKGFSIPADDWERIFGNAPSED